MRDRGPTPRRAHSLLEAEVLGQALLALLVLGQFHEFLVFANLALEILDAADLGEKNHVGAVE